MKKVFVTGSSGQLGREIIGQLHAQNIATVGVDIQKSETTSRPLDLTKATPQDLASLMSGCDGVIHTAALHGIHEPDFSREDFIELNIIATQNLLQAAHMAEIKPFVFTSSTSVYGDSARGKDKAVWVDENLPLRADGIYGLSKIIAESFCKQAADVNGLDITCLRISRILAMTERDIYVDRLYRGHSAPDSAKAHIIALQKSVASPQAGFAVYNLSGQRVFDKDDLTQLVTNPAKVIKQHIPSYLNRFQEKGWDIPRKIDRVYVSDAFEKAYGFACESAKILHSNS